MEDHQYQKAFNQGYILSQYKPEFIEAVKASPDPSIDYFQALLAGAKQFEKDKTKEQSKAPDLSKSVEKDMKDQDKDR